MVVLEVWNVLPAVGLTLDGVPSTPREVVSGCPPLKKGSDRKRSQPVSKFLAIVAPVAGSHVVGPRTTRPRSSEV